MQIFSGFISYCTEPSQYPISAGIFAGVAHGIVQATASVKFQTVNSSIANQAIKDGNAILDTTSSSSARTFVMIRNNLTSIFLQPLYWELIFRDSIYSYVENNFSNAYAINFVAMPILFGALHFDPRIKPLYLRPISYTSLGFLLALLRKSSGGLKCSLTAQITNNIVAGFIGGVAMGLEQIRQERASR